MRLIKLHRYISSEHIYLFKKCNGWLKEKLAGRLVLIFFFVYVQELVLVISI